jgi:hypothetical protein
MRINNSRISDLPWNDEAIFGAEQALADAPAKILAEAYCHVGKDGQRLGLHHEVVDDELLLNRQAIYAAMSLFQGQQVPTVGGLSSQGEATSPQPMLGIARADRIKALEHLSEHLEDLQQS